MNTGGKREGSEERQRERERERKEGEISDTGWENKMNVNEGRR
jgi:hypothetical protein